MPEYSNQQEAQLHRAIDDFRAQVVNKLEQIRQMMEVTNGLLGRMVENTKPTAIRVDVPASSDLVGSVNRAVSQSPAKPQFTSKKK